MTNHTVRRSAASAVAVAALFGTMLPAFALSVQINGSPVNLNPPPITRAGRVFVPLRGIFQRLGASVVYQNGTINATGANNRTVSLHIGSTQATVNGNSQPLDVAPFIIGASTYVPLRFVSQALGATVNYDAANRIVAIGTNGMPANTAAAPVATAASSALRIRNESPARNSYVQSTRPTIQTDFSTPANANSVHVTLDGRDVTSATTISTTGVVYTPQSDLQSSKHTVMVSGKDANGASFDRSWSFTSGTTAPTNSVTITSPANGSTVGGTFTISGHTTPNARVHIVAGSAASIGGIFAFNTGGYTGDTIADASGDFSQQVSLQTISGGQIGVTVTSTDPATKASAERKLRLRAQ
ncbi:MAG: copper amine oxidase N-terminal domain-containing protein [Candidatus Eremiobacteraeota bacterium]|nr:copper amine oxidase N-terminal domain-containing protein [Candidatus Eremiobacteraeota bacterium]